MQEVIGPKKCSIILIQSVRQAVSTFSAQRTFRSVFLLHVYSVFPIPNNRPTISNVNYTASARVFFLLQFSGFLGMFLIFKVKYIVGTHWLKQLATERVDVGVFRKWAWSPYNVKICISTTRMYFILHLGLCSLALVTIIIITRSWWS